MEEEQGKGRGLARGPIVGLAISAIALLLVAGVYLRQPDGAFALTIYSPWIVAVFGILFTLSFIRSRPRKWVLLVLGAWLAWGALASDEVHSSLRGMRMSAPPTSEFADRYRVVSLNCAGGSLDAAREMRAWRPDFVLLQESPSKKDVESLARELYGLEGHFVVGPDASIISRFKLRSFHEGDREPMNYVGAYAKISETGETWLVVSLRLQPPVLRFDYWNPACWSAYAEGKARRRLELQKLMDEVMTYDDDELMIVGGDFNAPPDRSIHEVMQSRAVDMSTMQDAAKVSGVGWTLTAVNEYPLVRIDQIWLDARVRPLRTEVVKTKYSDHRMVITDFATNPG